MTIRETDECIIIENINFSLIIGKNGKAQSLKYLPTSEELLADSDTPLFSVTQDRFFDNELKLMHPSREITLFSDSIRIENDCLIAGFSPLDYEAVISVEDKESFLVFSFCDFILHENAYCWLSMAKPPATGLRFLQLSFKEKAFFGEWMNTISDEKTTVSLMGTSPHTHIGSIETREGRILFADAVKGIRFKGCSAALFVSDKETFLDKVDDFEEAFDLPRGVKSRRCEKIKASTYWAHDATPENIEKHIYFAKKGGFSMMLLYYTCFVKEEGGYLLCGNYEFRDEYKNGLSDIKKMLERIKAEGITPGFHFLHSHIGLKSKYFTPEADRRVMHRQYHTLSRALGETETEVYVDQCPIDTELPENCRILRFGTELIHYTSCSDEVPYCYSGCTRGYNDTHIMSHPLGEGGGVVFMSEFGATSGYCDQNSVLQDEIAEKIAEIYNQGFEFIYFDGSEGTNAPYDYQIPMAQYRIYKRLDKEPLLCEAAAKGHFSWHMLSGGNAFDIFPTDVFKAMIDKYPLYEAPHMQMDFTRLNFGWWGFFEDTRADVYEYGTSHAAGYDCPITIQSNLERMEKHARVDDILEVMRRWEDVRAKKLLTEEQKQQIRTPGREFFLLLNKNNEYELTEYFKLETYEKDITAFRFERNGKSCAVISHDSTEGMLFMPISSSVIYRDEADGSIIKTDELENGVLLPLSGRRYLETDLDKSMLEKAFLEARLIGEKTEKNMC